jgi:hypothetical protein
MFSARLVAARNSDKVSEWHDVRYGNLAEAGEGESIPIIQGYQQAKLGKGMMMMMMMMMMCLTPLLLPAAVYRNTELHSVL